MSIPSFIFELLFSLFGLFCGGFMLFLFIERVQSRKAKQIAAPQKHLKSAPKHNSQYERQWHNQLLHEFEDNAVSFLEAIYAKRPIYGEPWHFYYGFFTTLWQLAIILGFTGLIAILCWGWIQDNLVGTYRTLPHIPAWLEYSSISFMWLAAFLIMGTTILSMLESTTLLRWIGLRPKPWLSIDRNGVTHANRLIPWDGISSVSTTTTYARFNGARSYDVAIQLKDGQRAVITPPSDLVGYLPMPHLMSIGGTLAAQFTLVALLHYCSRFHWVHDSDSGKDSS